MARLTVGRVLSVALIAIGVTAGVAEADVPQDRYAFANGCYSLQTDQGQAIAASSAPFRMQATTLGTYLLYGVNEDFLADPGTGVPTPTAEPSTAAEWRLQRHGNSGYSLTNNATGNVIRVTFTEATGCAVYPEASTDAISRPARRVSPNKRPAYGYADTHMHWTAFEMFGGEWHCGRPWHPYGAAYALPDCAQYDQGSNGQIRAFLDGRTPGEPYDSVGWPTFGYWPGPDKLAEEGTYHKAVERAWLGGLRLLVLLYVDNEALCDLMTHRHLPCHDMNSVRVQNEDLKQLQDYVDAQNGGPGKGWLRTVTSPAEARRVINAGKLAVVKGIEMSRVLDCGELNGVAQCDERQVDASLAELKSMGVTSFFPVHKFDNGFGGTKMDSGELGYIVNAGNFSRTGHFWDIDQCTGPGSDKTQLTTPPTAFVASLVSQLAGTNPLPVYGPPPHCNQRDLTNIGSYLINRMIDEHFIIEIDHMDEKTADSSLSIVESRQYPGVIHSHGGWSSNHSLQRIQAAGGVLGFGTDINGIANQPGPPDTPIRYEFRSHDGRVIFDRHRWGQRTFDINTDGVANYGLWPDWIESRRLAGDDLSGFFRGAEDYLKMWELAWKHNG